MFGARALATLLCTLPAAALADRFGRKCAILPGLATEAAAMLIMAAARELFYTHFPGSGAGRQPRWSPRTCSTPALCTRH